MDMKFYRCAKCGKIIAMVKPSACPTMCCGEAMQEIIPGTTDASVEKHVPVFEVKDGLVTVTVGATEHPMLDAHYIEWISIQTKFGNQRKAVVGADNVFDFSLGNPNVAAPADVNATMIELLNTKNDIYLHGYTSA